MTDTVEETKNDDDQTFLAIQPVTKWVAQLATKGGPVPSPHTPDIPLYNSVNECIDANEKVADATDLGYRVSSKQLLDALTEDPEALVRVHAAFYNLGMSRDKTIAIVRAIRDSGVKFYVEKVASDDAKSVSDEPTEAPEGVSGVVDEIHVNDI